MWPFAPPCARARPQGGGELQWGLRPRHGALHLGSRLPSAAPIARAAHKGAGSRPCATKAEARLQVPACSAARRSIACREPSGVRVPVRASTALQGAGNVPPEPQKGSVGGRGRNASALRCGRGLCAPSFPSVVPTPAEWGSAFPWRARTYSSPSLSVHVREAEKPLQQPMLLPAGWHTP